jgi:hypothetical protein
VTAAKGDRDARLRQLADQARGANLDLGASLLNGLSTVDPADMDVARFFVLCGRLHSKTRRARDYADTARYGRGTGSSSTSAVGLHPATAQVALALQGVMSS